MSLQVSTAKKMTEVCLTEKLRYILLYEADFNLFHQFIFGKETIKNGFCQMNISAKKTTQKNVSSLTKPFLANLYQQARKPISNMSVDAAQCYDRANHVIMSLVWCSFIGVICSIGVLCRH